MANSFFFFSKKPLDIGVLTACFRNFGETYAWNNVLHCNVDDLAWLELYFDGEPESEWDLPEDRANLATATGTPRPFITQLAYRGRSPDPLLLHLPAWDDVWAGNESYTILSLNEVQQRIKLGVEWLTWIGRSPGDLLVHVKGQQLGGTIVVLDDGRVASAAQREATLHEKLLRCAARVASGDFEEYNYVFSSDRPLIEVVYAAMPTPAMRAITSVSDPTYPDIVLPVEFVTEAEFRERHGFVPRDLPSLRDRY